MKPTRVFHVITHIAIGGAERVALDIAKSPTEGFEYHIVEVVRARGSVTRAMLAEMRSAGIRVHRGFVPDIPFHFLFERIAALCFPLWFALVWLRWWPDVLHVHTEAPDMSVYAFFRVFPWLRSRVRIVRTIHSTRLWTGQKRVGAMIERWYDAMDCNVAISSSVAEAYTAAYGHAPRIVIPNGVAPVKPRQWPQTEPGRINVLFAGRLETYKGVAVLCDVLAAMKADDRFFFHIIGDGPMRPDVEKAVGECPNSRYYGAVFGLAAYLASFDCLFMPSEFEGFSILSLEASVAGLPVVAHDCPGLGVTLPPDWPLKSADNKASSYVALFTGTLLRSDRSALAKKSQRFVEDNFSVRSMQQKYEQIYRGIGNQ